MKVNKSQVCEISTYVLLIYMPNILKNIHFSQVKLSITTKLKQIVENDKLLSSFFTVLHVLLLAILGDI